MKFHGSRLHIYDFEYNYDLSLQINCQLTGELLNTVFQIIKIDCNKFLTGLLLDHNVTQRYLGIFCLLLKF